jgi:hypothetical protein
MFKIVSMLEVATSSRIMLIVYFFSLTTKESILLLVRLINLASKVTLEACVNNVFAFAINESSTKV